MAPLHPNRLTGMVFHKIQGLICRPGTAELPVVLVKRQVPRLYCNPLDSSGVRDPDSAFFTDSPDDPKAQ